MLAVIPSSTFSSETVAVRFVNVLALSTGYVVVSSVKSLIFVGTEILQVTSLLAFAVNVFTVVPFFWIVKVALFTAGIVGLFWIYAFDDVFVSFQFA